MQNTDNKKIIKYIGWGIALIASMYTIVGYVDISSDASSRAFAPLVLIEGGFYIAIGLVVAWFGHRQAKI